MAGPQVSPTASLTIYIYIYTVEREDKHSSTEHTWQRLRECKSQSNPTWRRTGCDRHPLPSSSRIFATRSPAVPRRVPQCSMGGHLDGRVTNICRYKMYGSMENVKTFFEVSMENVQHYLVGGCSAGVRSVKQGPTRLSSLLLEGLATRIIIGFVQYGVVI